MNNDAGQMTNVLIIVLVFFIALIFILGMIYLILKMKDSNKRKKNETNQSNELQTTTELDRQPVHRFMEFEKIEDNMIVVKDKRKYVMVIECQGINYDLMSAAEKNAVEEGFIQFLNTLRHPIQMCVQTRTVNLEDSIQTYKERVKKEEDELYKQQKRYEQMLASKRYTKQQLEQEIYELTKKRNLYEYGKDVMSNTERMSKNKNILKKQYYIIISYYTSELGNNNFDKNEIQNIAFSELYTKAQSIIRTLSVCSVYGKILDSEGLVDLLYAAYNRDQSEIFGIDKIRKARIEDSLYSTGTDLLEKKMQVLDDQISEDAFKMATEEVQKVKYAKQNEYDNIKKSIEQLIAERAKMIIEENQNVVGVEVAQKAISNIEKEEEGGKEDEQKEKKSRRGRKPKTIN